MSKQVFINGEPIEMEFIEEDKDFGQKELTIVFPSGNSFNIPITNEKCNEILEKLTLEK